MFNPLSPDPQAKRLSNYGDVCIWLPNLSGAVFINGVCKTDQWSGVGVMLYHWWCCVWGRCSN